MLIKKKKKTKKKKKGGNIGSCDLRVLLLNKYEISSISEYPVWR